MTHTPTPWKSLRWWESSGMTLDDFDADEREEMAAKNITRIEAANGACICAAHDMAEITPENAEFLCRAVNAHDDLVAALEMAVHALRDNDLDEMMAGEFEIITDALAKARRE